MIATLVVLCSLSAPCQKVVLPDPNAGRNMELTRRTGRDTCKTRNGGAAPCFKRFKRAKK